MERLVDATRIEQYILNNCSDNEEINAIYAEIINAPTVDAVEVVRCKDCSYCDNGWCYDFGIHMNDNEFCSGGERRTDETG